MVKKRKFGGRIFSRVAIFQSTKDTNRIIGKAKNRNYTRKVEVSKKGSWGKYYDVYVRLKPKRFWKSSYRKKN